MSRMDYRLEILDGQLEAYEPFKRRLIYAIISAGILMMSWMFFISDALDKLSALKDRTAELETTVERNSPAAYREKIARVNHELAQPPLPSVDELNETSPIEVAQPTLGEEVRPTKPLRKLPASAVPAPSERSAPAETPPSQVPAEPLEAPSQPRENAIPAIPSASSALFQVNTQNALNPVDAYYNNPKYETAMAAARDFYAKENFIDAAIWAKKANRINREGEESWLLYAKSMHAQGRTAEAIGILELYLNYKNSKAAAELIRTWR